MKSFRIYTNFFRTSAVFILAAVSFSANAADKALLDILLDNGAITESQHKELMQKPSLSSKDLGVSATTEAEVEEIVDRKVSEAMDQKLDKHRRTSTKLKN